MACTISKLPFIVADLQSARSLFLTGKLNLLMKITADGLGETVSFFLISYELKKY